MSTQVTLTGRLTADPELAYTKQGKAFARFTVVTAKRFKNDQSGEWEDRDTSFWRCVVFGQVAENVTESLLKGTAVIVQGTARQNNWETKEGEKRSSTEVVVDDIAPSLRWASVKVVKAERGKPAEPKAPADDPWQGDEPPF
jgi:single-strand DNA-binding protein